MVRKISELRATSDEDLIAEHDKLAGHTVAGTAYYMDELERRSRERAAMESHRLAMESHRLAMESHRLADRTFRLTIATSVLSVVALIVSVLALVLGG